MLKNIEILFPVVFSACHTAPKNEVSSQSENKMFCVY